MDYTLPLYFTTPTNTTSPSHSTQSPQDPPLDVSDLHQFPPLNPPASDFQTSQSPSDPTRNMEINTGNLEYSGRISKCKHDKAHPEEVELEKRTKETLEIPNDATDPPPTTNPLNPDESTPPLFQQPPHTSLADLTSTPIEGYPPVNSLNKRELFASIHPDSLAAWHSAPGPKLVAYIANDRPIEEGTARVNLITTLLQDLLDFPAVFVRHGRPTLDNCHPERKTAFLYFIGGISAAQAQCLTEQRCWSTLNITIFALPLDPPISHYTMTLGKIPLPLTSANELRIKLRGVAVIKQFIVSHNNNIPCPIITGLITNIILDTLQVKSFHVIEDGQRIKIFNVYIIPPTREPQRYAQWIGLLKNLTYVSIYGTGIPCDSFHCNICKAQDHPAGLCPYPLLPEWNPGNALPPPQKFNRDSPWTRG